MAYDEGTAARLRAALAGESPSEKRMFGGIAFLIGGNMCVGLVGDDLVVRVGAEGDAAALAEPHARPMDFTGKPMKGWVFVAPAGYRTDAALAAWVRRGLAFARGLPAKGAKAPRAARKPRGR